MKTIITHNAKFHADDVFGVASLLLLLGKENCRVIRTRDPEVVSKGDYVLDVGGVSDQLTNRFDHHQAGGAGARTNGIQYASFGLIWKKYGEELCGSREAAEMIDEELVQAVDAGDNGIDMFDSKIPGVLPLTVSGLVDLYRATWKEDKNWDERFLECVAWAQEVLKREMKISLDTLEGIKRVEQIYAETKDKRLVVFPKELDLGRELVGRKLWSYPEPLYAVLYRSDSEDWQVLAVRKHLGSFALRKPLPEAWGAKSGTELEKVTGVPGSVFCHRGLFMCLNKTKEGALKLAELALNA